jgi:hypothetical protein
MVNGLIGVGVALLSVWFGAWLTLRQKRAADAEAERERQLALMQQLVVAASELTMARRIHEVTWTDAESRLRVGVMAAMEFLAVWGPGRTWETGLAGLTPAARVVHDWGRSAMKAASALAPHMAKVSAAGLPLGMVEDRAVATAAQQLMDACLENKGEAAINEAIRALRAAFYPEPSA